MSLILLFSIRKENFWPQGFWPKKSDIKFIGNWCISFCILKRFCRVFFGVKFLEGISWSIYPVVLFLTVRGLSKDKITCRVLLPGSECCYRLLIFSAIFMKKKISWSWGNSYWHSKVMHGKLRLSASKLIGFVETQGF